MSDLEAFRDHAAVMATAGHRPECRAEDAWGLRYIVPRWQYPDPDCPGCISDADRELWSRLADEVDAYLSHDDEPDLFGAES